MRIENRNVVGKLTDYLNHRVSLPELVDWAEQAMMDGDFVGKDWKTVRDIVARIGVADVRAFGLTWEDCEQSLMELGYRTEVQISQAFA
jgi:cobyrinic acid a,c-diamide synthase